MEQSHSSSECALSCLARVPPKLCVLMVDEVPEDHVLEYASSKARNKVCDIALPLVTFESLGDVHHDEIAIVSWRWDLDLDRPSVNLSRALRRAKDERVRYLLIDVLSIDQTLPPAQLIQRVYDYTSLYGDLPVITAYHHDTDNVVVTVTRPWILHEVKRFGVQRQNKIYYTQQYGEQSSWSDADAVIAYIVKTAANADYALSIARLLNGLTNGLCTMHCIADFRYLLPEHVNLITTAYEQMNAADYLMTLLILSLDHRWRIGNQYPCDDNDLGFDHTAQFEEPYGAEIMLERCSSHVRYTLVPCEEQINDAGGDITAVDRNESNERKLELLLLDNVLIGTVSGGERILVHSLQFDARLLVLRSLGLRTVPRDFGSGMIEILSMEEQVTYGAVVRPQRVEFMKKMIRLQERAENGVRDVQDLGVRSEWADIMQQLPIG